MIQNIMNNIAKILVASLLVVGCASSHELPPEENPEGGEPTTCAVEWLCYDNMTPEGDWCPVNAALHEPCEPPDEGPTDCPGTWERIGGMYNFTPGDC